MLVNAPDPAKTVEKELLIEEIGEWLKLGVEKEGGEPPGLLHYQRGVLAALEQKLREKKERLDLLIKSEEEHV